MKTPIVSIPFKGAYYMCVAGSPRAYTLKAANFAFSRGRPEVAEDLRAEAMEMPGCAFEARENGTEELGQSLVYYRE